MDEIAICKRFKEICIYKLYNKMETKMETKKCIHCDTIKTIDLFYMHGKQIRNVCKECQKLQQRLYYEQNKEEILEDKKEYRGANRE